MKRIGLSLMAMIVAVLCMAQTRGAQYPGGDEAYREFLKKNIKYPVTSKNNSVEGYCNLKFKVKVDGTTENVCVVGSTGDADLDNEALRIVSLLKFDPAMNDGEKVECEAKCSVLFQLDQPKLEKVENLKSGIGFPGGVAKIRKYVEERVEYPQSCLDDSISGACQVFFVVNADSTISNKRIMWSSGNIELDREAIRQISRLQGLLSPAVNDKDKPVASSFHLQIEFCAYRKCYTTFLRNVITSKLSPDDSIEVNVRLLLK